MRMTLLSAACLLALAPLGAGAATYTVGPPGTGVQYDHSQLSAVFSSRNLAPGDIIEVRGSATYNGGVVVGSDDGGTASNPVVIRWSRTPGTTRPLLQGGAHTIKFAQSDHVVFDGFEVTGGTSTCVFNEAHDVTVRDALIHDCPAHGILGADDNSGSFTLEYSEIYNAGEGTQKHPIYMTSDQVVHPGAIFRMQFNYIHNGLGGNLLKSRHERNEIYYNWFEGAKYQEIELIGPDCVEQPNAPTWTRALKREDSDLVGNVIVHTSTSWSNAIRLGGDLNGASDGYVRLVNNTILFDRPGSVNAVYVQLGLGSLEMHNNVIYQPNTSAAPAIVKENTSAETPECAPFVTQPWSNGRQVFGSNNWVETTATSVPPEWTQTTKAADPNLENIAQRRLRPITGSGLIDEGTNTPPAPPAFPFPGPLAIPQFDPPQHAKLAVFSEVPRAVQGGAIDIGAYESVAVTAPGNLSGVLAPSNPPNKKRIVQLSWSGGASIVDVYGNGVLVNTVGNTGNFAVSGRSGYGQVSYIVCNQNSTVCSSAFTIMY